MQVPHGPPHSNGARGPMRSESTVIEPQRMTGTSRREWSGTTQRMTKDNKGTVSNEAWNILRRGCAARCFTETEGHHRCLMSQVKVECLAGITRLSSLCCVSSACIQGTREATCSSACVTLESADCATFTSDEKRVERR